jgi:hypothetical protein
MENIASTATSPNRSSICSKNSVNYAPMIPKSTLDSESVNKYHITATTPNQTFTVSMAHQLSPIPTPTSLPAHKKLHSGMAPAVSHAKAASGGVSKIIPVNLVLRARCSMPISRIVSLQKESIY